MKMGFSGWIKKQSEKVKTNRVGLQFHPRPGGGTSSQLSKAKPPEQLSQEAT